ncbi:gamma-aminobutyric acid receptor subunit rho-1-like [Penaeus japonicus]|uniref:gamma-aminobutyric acid receptor subunit rho-1-like n=1 Tax=Penaeus japonicus TaxID=27405 RepID=UPI001C70F9CC|nr:gamma-aminobutyric acid receptor subunit rho-1-like [Penaeus japonicus]
MNAPFVCNMDLRMFPFDTQHCKLLLTLTSARVDFLDWRRLGVVYLGETFLTEYEVDTITIQRSSSRNYSVAEVGITLHRRFWSYVTSAYLPTVMLMLISYASLFCKRENVDLRVMMALTTLLVLYALYQQISDDLPKTAYTKAIDVWCFFAITMMFTQVIYHILLDLDIRICTSLRRRKEADLTAKDPWTSEELLVRTDRVFRILYVVVKFTFFLAYGCVVLVTVHSRGRH